MDATDPSEVESWHQLQVGYQEIAPPSEFPIQWGRHTIDDRPIVQVHAHNALELGYCWEGAGVFLVEGRLQEFRAGDVSVIRGDDLHLARAEQGGSCHWSFMFFEPGRLVGDPGYDPEWLRSDVLGGPEFENIVHHHEHPGICAVVRELARELDQRSPGYRASARGLVAGLMPMLQRLPGRSESERSEAGTSFARIAPALGCIANALTEEVRIEELARMCELSPAHFRRLFQAAVGESPKQYLLRFRIHNAAAMLEQRDRKVTDVAFASGFQNLSSFNRHFRSIMGCSPSEWRKRGLR